MNNEFSDLTIVYYTSNRIDGGKIRNHFLDLAHKEIHIVSVSQKPINFGKNICVGDIGVSKYNIYKQIYTGVRTIRTKYVACCEDDTLYNYDHFTFRPEKDVFAYDCNMWFADKDEYWRRPLAPKPNELRTRSGMFGCIAETETMFVYLDNRFKKFPEPDPSNYDWGEPLEKAHFYLGKIPLIVFIHNEFNKNRRENQKRKLLERHKRESLPEDHIKNVEPYGDIVSLWRKYDI
jgi:hypothetical protein